MNRSLRVHESNLDAVFQALANQTRRALLARLRAGPAMVTELAKPFRLSLNAISKHLFVLQKAGLIRRAVEGRMHSCSLSPQAMAQANAWLQEYQVFWEDNLDNIKRFVENGDVKLEKAGK